MTCKERILSEEYYDLITDYLFPQVYLDRQQPDYCYESIDEKFGVVYVEQAGIPEISAAVFGYSLIPKLFGLMQNTFDPLPLINSGILRAQNPPLSLTGRGVILAFVDTGIDYQNPVFQDESGNTRILSIWDQTIQEGIPPEGFLYGTEYSKEEINAALQGDGTVPTRDEIGHGSQIASVAAGSRLGKGIDFIGAAPEAEIVVVKLKPAKQNLRDYYMIAEDAIAYEENDIMLGVKYVSNLAISFQRPVVLCLGLGTNYGDHAGNLALAQYLEKMASLRSRAVIVCGGNEGAAAHHFYGTIAPSYEAADQNFVDVEIRVGEREQGFVTELWGSVPEVFWISLKAPGGESVQGFRPGLGKSETYRFIYDRTVITVDSILVEQTSGEELIVFKFINPTPGIWTVRVSMLASGGEGVFHMWLPITTFLRDRTYFLEPSPYTTLTNPGYAPSVITTSTYDDENNSLYTASGRGFARNGAIKPDLASPGVDISTLQGQQTGSSFAAAICAGAVAQFMQWAIVEENEPLVRSREIKNYFIRGAEREFGKDYPNREFGYGTLDIVGAFNALAGI